MKLSKQYLENLAESVNIDLSKVGIDQFILGLNSEKEHKDVAELISDEPLEKLKVYAMITAAHFRENVNYYNQLKEYGID